MVDERIAQLDGNGLRFDGEKRIKQAITHDEIVAFLRGQSTEQGEYDPRFWTASTLTSGNIDLEQLFTFIRNPNIPKEIIDGQPFYRSTGSFIPNVVGLLHAFTNDGGWAVKVGHKDSLLNNVLALQALTRMDPNREMFQAIDPSLYYLHERRIGMMISPLIAGRSMETPEDWQPYHTQMRTYFQRKIALWISSLQEGKTPGVGQTVTDVCHNGNTLQTPEGDLWIVDANYIYSEGKCDKKDCEWISGPIADAINEEIRFIGCTPQDMGFSFDPTQHRLKLLTS